MANPYQLKRQDLIKGLRFLSAQAADERDYFVLSYALRLLTTDKPDYLSTMILAAVESGYQTRQELVEVTGRSDKSVRETLYKLVATGVLQSRVADDGHTKVYWLLPGAHGLPTVGAPANMPVAAPADAAALKLVTDQLRRTLAFLERSQRPVAPEQETVFGLFT